MYRKFWKRLIDFVLSLLALILLFVPLLILSAIIFFSDPGPVFFVQKRVGIHKTFFRLHKFRSMKQSTPHDTPTHLLENPEQYITAIGKFLRRTSLDELPQLWDILIGKMSFVGPRPALWNQDDLIALRDRYGACDVRPGLTGWAQINGRDELELGVKAKLDGDYVAVLNYGGWRAFLFDCKCFFGTFSSAVRGDGILEGGTGKMHKNGENK